MNNRVELTKRIEKAAYAAGVDLVGFASLERFPDGMPSRIFRGAKSVIGIAYRVLRGSLRGVEEGTTYYQYTTTGVEAIEETVMPMALLRVSALLEAEGVSFRPDGTVDLERCQWDGTLYRF